MSAGTSPAAPPPAAAPASVPSAGVSPLSPGSRLGQPAARTLPAPIESTSPPANPADRVEIEFAPGSASVPPASLPALRTLADKRGNRLIEALGRGDAGSADPAAQEKAVTLGFARAQSIASALAASGVPRGAIQVMSLAAGSGGMAQLLE
ncbi:MAG TPA: hypothetical protein VFW75_08345 [Acetobacteraceae bacterium]|nr:hypothetical protein [Acetobacteraceae bacterium]